MPSQSLKPYWIDEQDGSQEGYHYGETYAKALVFEYDGRSIRLILPELTAPTAVRVAAAAEDLLFLIGERLVQEDEEIEEGYGAMMIARRLPNSKDTYWLLVWHSLFPETMRFSGCLEWGSRSPALLPEDH